MPWMGAAAIAGSSLIGSAINSSAAGNAANTQAASSAAAIGEQAREYDTARSDNAPYREAGANSIGELQRLLGMGPEKGFTQQAPDRTSILDNFLNSQSATYGVPKDQLDQGFANQWADKTYAAQKADYDQASSAYNAANPNADPEYGALNKKFSIADFWNDPVVAASYQSGLDLGTKALKNASPLTTGLDSGAALKELTKFGTDYTGNMAAGSQARYVGDQTNQYNRLAGIAGVGQQAVAQTTAAGTNAANNTAGLISAQGNASAAGNIASSNAWSGGLSSVSNYWQQQQMLNKLQGTQLSNTYGAGNVYGVGGAGQVPTSVNWDV